MIPKPVLALVVCVFAGAAACQSEPTVDKSWQPAVVSAKTLDAELAKLPLAAYQYSGKEQATEAKALDLLVRRCMSRYEVTVAPISPAELHRIERRTEQQKRMGIGLVDPDEAARYGYQGRPEDRDQSLGGPAKDTRFSPEDQQLLVGTVRTFRGQPVPDGGCRQEAANALLPKEPGGKVVPVRMAGVEAANAAQALRSDDRFLAMAKSWKSCMKAQGYDAELANSEGGTLGAGRSQSGGTAMAVADVRCKEQVNYLGVYVALLREYQQKTLNKNAETLAKVKNAKEQMLKNAAKTLGE